MTCGDKGEIILAAFTVYLSESLRKLYYQHIYCKRHCSLFSKCQVERVCSLVGRYFYNMYIHSLHFLYFLYFFNVKDSQIVSCLHKIRLSYNT